MSPWLSALNELASAYVPHVLVTLVETPGFTPREPGVKMVVTADGQAGTIGGGVMELKALALARGMLSGRAGRPRLEKLDPGDSQCGGVVTLLLEPFLPAAREVALFGAGHVGRALVRVLDGVAVRVLWIDDRQDIFPSDLPPGVRAVHCADPHEAVALVSAGAHALVMTHSHERDYRLIERLVGRNDLKTVGLIGSAAKWGRFRRRLSESGVTDERIAGIRCPIGLPGITGRRPAEIAIAIAAQLLLDGTADEPAETSAGEGIPT
jgi:xanthine dehydrogenase accessory factor